MRFPFSLTRSMTAYLLRKKLAGETKFPLVLDARTAARLQPVLRRLRADPRIRRHDAPPAVDRAMPGRGRRVRRADRERLRRRAADLSRDRSAGREPRRRSGNTSTSAPTALLLEKKLPGFRPSSRLFINVHLDGMEATHDRHGRAARACSRRRSTASSAAKAAGFQVCTNTTVYHDTDMHEIAVLFDYLHELGVDGFMISPAFGYAAVARGRSAAARRAFS